MSTGQIDLQSRMYLQCHHKSNANKSKKKRSIFSTMMIELTSKQPSKHQQTCILSNIQSSSIANRFCKPLLCKVGYNYDRHYHGII
ncbi:hypothetical protein Hanom_Chr06g00515651 [Helianthus anomalus]